jgi:hypothetical protein
LGGSQQSSNFVNHFVFSGGSFGSAMHRFEQLGALDHLQVIVLSLLLKFGK